ncbi:hypothetical protein FACS1894139_06210 [Planctomycetales bacterium]|nr:hypothetical protein FACS1894107_00560 [Planctomycetales bacterium]GHS90605.1 hypothetical protein FACS1894107_01910 [Planctomycetales bacterium]GHS96136.1 hypothetical protein FACS1894108_00230 [Planctomycetales bacterium]GHS99177.1 hypothetical protein FACS1894108_08660 [Planctomycetales bacterium]GHT04293.1 hypothetical protein FACS1894139_06210 [Planctomycetales bacterium]
MAYDPKFRQCVLDFIDDGNSMRDACEHFKVGRTTVYNWRQQLATTGSLCSQPRAAVPRKIPTAELREYIAAHPDDYLREMATHFHCSESGVWRALNRLGVTHKKKRPATAKPRRSNAKNT